MRRSSFRRRSAFFSSPGRVALFVGALLLVILLLIRFVAPGAFFALSAPFLSLGSFFTSSLDDKEEKELGAQLRDNRALLNENVALASKVADLQRLVGSEGNGATGVVASVIARPPLAPYDTLIVSPSESITRGSLVSAEGGVPIGTVEMLAGTRAQVALFSTSGRATDGWVGEERLPVTLVGEGAGAFSAEVPRDAALTEGSLVYLPGPGARPVGRILRIDADPSSPSAKLFIEPLVNIFSVTEVLIEETP